MFCVALLVVLCCTKFGAAPLYELQQRAGGCTNVRGCSLYAVFQRCGAPEFAMWAGLIFLLASKDGSLRRPLAPGSPDVSRHLAIARFAGRTRESA